MAFNEQDACESPDPVHTGGPAHDRGSDKAGGRRRRRTVLLWPALTIALVVLGLAGYCVHDALALPGKDGTAVKLARWGRCHHLNSVADLMDGRPRPRAEPAADCAVNRVLRPTRPTTEPKSRFNHAGLVRIHPPARPRTAPDGEGAGAPVGGRNQPAVRSAIVRPNGHGTGFPVRVVLMRHTVLRFDQLPGAADLCGHWPTLSTATPADPPCARPPAPTPPLLAGAGLTP